eukprot:Gregarina_sp_Poly_1__492@NODE_111_length_13906_cov_58_362887_g98_i0_p12_GENE_NODE_111_length_13906_cov_58_362887_g98_i0NODE_111_length_13906_cov_58_362887_g98_i0_p12_ORF_typecomplete_len125_score20_54Ku_N/PF03731_15/0_00014_NODE_111_length_13906_cov_58_362887_g98_i069727346
MEDFDPTAFEHLLAEEDEGEEEGDAGDADVSAPDSKFVKQQPFKQAILICLDIHTVTDLFPNSSDSSGDANLISWKTLVQTLCHFLKSRIVSNEHDKIGVTMFGSRHSQNDYKFDCNSNTIFGR